MNCETEHRCDGTDSSRAIDPRYEVTRADFLRFTRRLVAVVVAADIVIIIVVALVQTRGLASHARNGPSVYGRSVLRAVKRRRGETWRTNGSMRCLLISQSEGGYVVSVPDLPDVVTEGETREQALAMAKDAIKGYLDTMREHNWPLRTAERDHVVVRSA